MGLRYLDLESWRRWQTSRKRLRSLRARLRPTAPCQLQWWVRGTDPKLLVACDSASPSTRHSLLTPLSGDALIAHPAGLDLGLSEQWRVAHPDHHLDGIERVFTTGDHLEVGAWAHAEARQRGWRQFVPQHGLITPYGPPPPLGVEVLAWSDADASYLAEGRPDLSFHVVGSPLLEAAAADPAPAIDRCERPVFLGQLHGAELPRLGMTAATTSFWRKTGASYRPHPIERDKLSRAQHQLWRWLGMQFEDAPLGARPVVGMFSTGVLEAAARGVPAWVYYPRPPSWLEEFWERYAMARWGAEPTKVSLDPGSPTRRITGFMEGA